MQESRHTQVTRYESYQRIHNNKKRASQEKRCDAILAVNILMDKTHIVCCNKPHEWMNAIMQIMVLLVQWTGLDAYYVYAAL